MIDACSLRTSSGQTGVHYSLWQSRFRAFERHLLHDAVAHLAARRLVGIGMELLVVVLEEEVLLLELLVLFL